MGSLCIHGNLNYEIRHSKESTLLLNKLMLFYNNQPYTCMHLVSHSLHVCVSEYERANVLALASPDKLEFFFTLVTIGPIGYSPTPHSPA